MYVTQALPLPLKCHYAPAERWFSERPLQRRHPSIWLQCAGWSPTLKRWRRLCRSLRQTKRRPDQHHGTMWTSQGNRCTLGSHKPEQPERRVIQKKIIKKTILYSGNIQFCMQCLMNINIPNIDTNCYH